AAPYTSPQAYVVRATDDGSAVRLRAAAELARQSVMDNNESWTARQDETIHIDIATPADLAWSDGYILGAPTRFGQPSSQLKQFIDTTSGPWVEGQLAGKPATVFTSTTERHGGQEATLMSLHDTRFH